MTKQLSIRRRLLIPAMIAAVVITIDQLTKAWVIRTWTAPNSGDMPIIAGWLDLTYVQNTGVAFGLFGGMPQLFTVTSLIIVVLAIRLYLKHVPSDHGWLALSLGLIVGGAIGNVIDRVRFGYVIDFIKTFDGHFPVFNVADACVVVGVAVMLLFLSLMEGHSRSAQPVARVEAEDGH
jgi:signal peptidase II